MFSFNQIDEGVLVNNKKKHLFSVARVKRNLQFFTVL